MWTRAATLIGTEAPQPAIQRHIEDPLADFVLGRDLLPGSTIVVARRNDDEVDIDVIPPTIPEDVAQVTVPPEEPVAPEGEGDADSE